MSALYFTPRIRHAWWVRPLLGILAFNASIGIPCDVNRVAIFIAKHGVRVTLEPAKA